MADALDQDRTQPGTAIDRRTRRHPEAAGRLHPQRYDAALVECDGDAGGPPRAVGDTFELTECRGSAWHPHARQLAFNVGRQSVGHQLVVDLTRACDGHYETMEREVRAARRQEAVEQAAFEAERRTARRTEDIGS